MTTCPHTSILLWFFCFPMVTNSLLSHSNHIFLLIWMTFFCPEMSTIHRILHIYFLHVYIMSCLHKCYLCHFWVFVHWFYFYQLYVMFSISSFVSFDEIYAKLYTWNASTSMIHNCGIFCQCISLYKFHFPSLDFSSVSAYLFLLSRQCW